jgi:hypothetical protein
VALRLGMGRRGPWKPGIRVPAPPGACRDAIARLETALNEARASGRVIGSAQESIGARLHHQPTRDSVAKAESESVQNVKSSLDTARKLRAEGKRSDCVALLEKIVPIVRVP